MAVQDAGWADWSAPVQEPLLFRIGGSLAHFARKKPVGFVCAVIIAFLFVIGDAVPESLNKLARTEIALGGVVIKPDLGEPVPYLADQLEQTLGFVHSYERQELGERLEGSSSKHLLGTDHLGRDILSRLIYGARVAVMVAFGGMTIAVSLGAAIGIISGFYLGWIDKVLYRFVDVFHALPTLVLFIVILGVFGSGLWQMIFVLGLVFAPGQSRLIRGQTISVMSSPYIEAARVVGASDRRIMTHYVLPNVFYLIVLNATFLLGILVLVEATLSFLGFGLPPPFPSWGQMLSLEGRKYMHEQPGLAVYPGIAIGILVFSFNMFGDALRDALDPRLRGSG